MSYTALYLLAPGKIIKIIMPLQKKDQFSKPSCRPTFCYLEPPGNTGNL